MAKNKWYLNMTDNLYKETFHQVMDIWVEPEIKRRQEKGLLPKPLNLRAAQVIFYSDERPNKIRINDEVKIVGEVKLKNGLKKQKGELVYSYEINNVKTLKLPESEDPNCGHISLYRLNNEWLLAFDFIYNKGHAKEFIRTSKEFLEAAKYSLE